MDNVTLKKKLSAYISDAGRLKNLNEDILYEVLIAWENWTGPSADFYRTLGFTYKQMAGVIGKAKKLKRDGVFGGGEFKQIRVDGDLNMMATEQSPCAGAEIIWTNGRIIRFAGVDMLLDFLKKAS